MSGQDPEVVVLTYHFIQSDSVTGLTVGEITGISKEGWQYAWTQYGDGEKDATAKRVAQPPIAVYVGDVYEEANFGALRIGT